MIEKATCIDSNKKREIEYYPAKAVRKEMDSLPERRRDKFLVDLNLIAHNQAPTCQVTHLNDIGNGVTELKINGRPAFRCIFYTKEDGKVYVLHATEKTTNGSDRQLKNVVAQRYKQLRSDLKEVA
ncbi:type II toxin-antitoxin system RelE/ParE family toxin [Pseudomonas japonica]|uniref:Phage-related protein n=1 Tax=Pseudomonas japonica TaxID=256466 RepID=A0A239C7C2_9PSED|nr:type II toxin-antitoxin system RelE/ParE family toxin [Pseudomonas japonica]SNS16010.1 Phage-related protein [Pseudomonas japonica]